EIVGATSRFNVIAGNIVGTGVGGQSFPSKGRTIVSSNGLVKGIPVFAGAQLNGVVIIGASQNTIGADTRIAGSAPNTISGNIQVGVYITRRDFEGNVYPVPTGNVVSGNTLQSDGLYGVLLFNAPRNLVRPFTASSPFLVPNRIGGGMIGFRNFLSAFDAGISLPTRRLRVARHGKAAHALLRARPRVPALFEPGSGHQRVGEKGATRQARPSRD